MTSLSHQIEAAIAALDANPNPTPEQLATVRQSLREVLCQQLDFARDVEAHRLGRSGVIPVLSGVGITRRHYHWLQQGRRRPDPHPRRLVVVS